jgi:hypothetical protein
MRKGTVQITKKDKEAVIDETTLAINLFKLTRLGELMPRPEAARLLSVSQI